MILNPVIAGGGVETVKGTLTSNLSTSRWQMETAYVDGNGVGKSFVVENGTTVEIEIVKNSMIYLPQIGGIPVQTSGEIESIDGGILHYIVKGDFTAETHKDGDSN